MKTAKMPMHILKNLIETDPEIINSRRYGYSLKSFLDRNPDGVANNVIANLLCRPTSEIEQLYEGIIKKYQSSLKLDK